MAISHGQGRYAGHFSGACQTHDSTEESPVNSLLQRFSFILVPVVLSGCITFQQKKPEETVKVSLEFKDDRSEPSEGYQRIRSASGKDDERFCEDSFSAAFARNLLKAGSESSLTLFMDKKQILLFSYDNKKRTCTKENVISDVLEGYKRKDIAREEKHEINLVFVDSTKIGTVKQLLDIADSVAAVGGQAFLAAGARAPADQVASMVDELISSSLSISDKRTITFPLPKDSAHKLEIKAIINDKPYNLAEVWLEGKASLYKGMNARRVMTKKLLANETPNAVLERIRNGESRSLIVGRPETVVRECAGLRKVYEESLTEYDMRYMQESYLVSTHGSHISPQYLNACFDSTDEGRLVSAELKASMQHYWGSIGSGRGFRFMENFTATSPSPPSAPDTKLEYAPLGFAYKNVGELLSATNQGPARCYQFSIEPRIFYFVKALDGTPYYFTGHVDRSYSEEEENGGSRSTIVRLEVSSDVWPVGNGEYASKQERCLNIYKTAYKNQLAQGF